MQLLVSCGPVRLRAPERPGSTAGTNKPIDCWFIRVWEPSPPEGVEALEWVLYADERTETLEAALVGVMDYATRFLIEEFHKGLKTGLKAEELQLETGHRLFRGDRGHEHRCLATGGPSRIGPSGPEAAATVTGLSDSGTGVVELGGKPHAADCGERPAGRGSPRGPYEPQE